MWKIIIIQIKADFVVFRLCTELEESANCELNHDGAYPTVCVELDIASLAVNTIIEVV